MYKLAPALALALALNYPVIDSAIFGFFRSRVSAVRYLVRVFRFGCRCGKIPDPNLVLMPEPGTRWPRPETRE